MNQELPTIEQIKDKLNEWIRMAEDATPGPWEVDSANGVMASDLGWLPVCYPFGDKQTEVNDATFIATSRTAAPLAWKALLSVVDGLQDVYSPSEAYDLTEAIREQFKEVVP